MIAFGIISYATAHIVMYFLRAHEGWHRATTYFAALTGGLGLIASIYQSDAQLTQWRLEVLRPERVAKYDNLLTQVEFERDYLCETRFVRSQDSPPDFDSMVADQRTACGITQRLIAILPSIMSIDRPVALLALEQPSMKTGAAKSGHAALKSLVIDYNSTVREIASLQAEAGPSPAEVSLALYAPFLLIAGFSFGVAAIMFPARSTREPKRELRSMRKPRRRPKYGKYANRADTIVVRKR